MLVLSRKSGEIIEVGGEISVEVISVRGNRVQIGIRAPKDVRIIRGELAFRDQEVEGVPYPSLSHTDPDTISLKWTPKFEQLDKV